MPLPLGQGIQALEAYTAKAPTLVATPRARLVPEAAMTAAKGQGPSIHLSFSVRQYVGACNHVGAGFTSKNVVLSFEGAFGKMTTAAASSLGTLTKELVVASVDVCLPHHQVSWQPSLLQLHGREKGRRSLSLLLQSFQPLYAAGNRASVEPAPQPSPLRVHLRPDLGSNGVGVSFDAVAASA